MKCIICGSKTYLFYKDLFDDRYGAPGFYSIYCCRKCGFGRTDPVLEKDKIGKFYKKYYPLSILNVKKLKETARIRPKLMAWIAGVDNKAHLHIKENSQVLDIGSGSGKSLLEIEKLNSKAFGVEPDPNAQIIAKSLKLNVFIGFINDNPFPGEKFDFITGSQVLEHDPDPVNFLKSAKRKLKMGGQIILSFPNFNSIYRKIFGRKWINWHIPYHVNFFTNNSLERLTKKTGLKIVNVRTITPNLWTLIQLRSLLINPEEGKKSLIWKNATQRQHVVRKSFSLKKYILVLAASIFYVLITFVNRAVDILGMGDSILIVLENEK